MTQPSPPITVADLEKAQREEWGTYVALVPIDIGGCRAFNPADPVPASHIASGVVAEHQVTKTTTKAGQQAVAAIAEKG